MMVCSSNVLILYYSFSNHFIGVGKSSLITALIKDTFVPNIQSVLPAITIPRDFSSSPYSPNATVLVDTNSQDIPALQKEIRRADVIWLVYSDHYTYERISLYWMNIFRSLGVNLPVVLCANKSDLSTSLDSDRTISDEFIPILKEYKEVESCIRCSAKDKYNVSQAFYLCQRAVTHPISPLFDAKEGNLKRNATAALSRIFFLCDKDQDGFLDESEFLALQKKCFGRSLDINDLADIKQAVNQVKEGTFGLRGLTEEGFIILNKIFAEKGRHETTWGILRTFHYTDSLSLNDKFLYPVLDVPSTSSVELSPIGYRFFVDLFLLFDKDNDGGLNEEELQSLFKPTPGVPREWIETNFPQTTVRNEQGYVTLQGWLAQWSMTTYLDYKTTLSYLAYLGFESAAKGGTTVALKVTKPRKERVRSGKNYRIPVNDRSVFNCYVLGSSGSGKSSLLEALLGRQFSEIYNPTIKPRIVVNSVELKGGKQVYLILEELGELEPAILDNQSKLNQCDVLCLTYDSSDPNSFHYLVELGQKHSLISSVPSIIVALKADLDRQQQRCDIQPEEYTTSLNIPSPLHISSAWPSSLTELFVQLVEASNAPASATPGLEPEVPNDNLQNVVLATSAVGFMSIMSLWIWKMSMQQK
ncbi:Mitochondrial Rho GTPase 1 [Wickerhamomyces ciferrii]|uniref:Mitochondrial Rho GTPase n=1 Tax=Wickerhamomyces ciferrii (strain ATCC 14091 / BCRC 22168 / CBS 111 / JCM 3599 / NBRC 0793 / NRRL Y-1031 F-60-10) TaxID=1206466 RepID=K0KJB0_WICCF|nr:Mitochondrial Rho GTPase 1 [Wickerhamomyces ciferrii]CCH45310.1 Mitochondrial Rho GTPase 1 [Wickerhamomyces ciferrii]